MIPLLLQSGQTIDPRKAIFDQFNKQPGDPATWSGVILVIAAILILLLVLHFILYYERRTDETQSTRDPLKLFKEVLCELELSTAERDLLKRLARDLELASPTALLLSPTGFSNHVQKWLSMSKTKAKHEQQFQQLSRKLFGSSWATNVT